MMATKVTKTLSMIIALAMVFTMMPVSVFAAPDEVTDSIDIGWTRSPETKNGIHEGGFIAAAENGIENLLSELKPDNQVAVWDGNTRSPYFSKTANDDHSCATWRSVDWVSYNSSSVRLFRGAFTLPDNYSAEDTLMLTTVAHEAYVEAGCANNGNILPINDNIYIFLHSADEELTDENYLDYLIFYTGNSTTDTLGGLNRTKIGRYCSRAEFNRWTSLDQSNWTINDTLYSKMKNSDGWYAEADFDNLGASLFRQYPDAKANDRFVIEVFAEDSSSDHGGGMDELVLLRTRVEAPVVVTYPVTVEYYQDSLNGTKLGAAGYTKTAEAGDKITLDSEWLNKFRPADYKDGVQQGETPYVVIDGTNVIKVLYTAMPKYSYRIDQEYYTVLDGTQNTTPDYTVTGTVQTTTDAGEKTVTAPASAHTGYTFDATQSTLSLTLSEEENVYVFTAVYTKSETTPPPVVTPEYSYRIDQEYYTVLDGTQKTTADYTVTGTVQTTTDAGEKTVTAPASAHTGYTFDATQSTLSLTLSEEENVYVFTAVYTKSVTTPKYSYRINQEYYTVLDGTQKTTADYTVTGDVNKTTVAGEKTVTAPTSAYTGYTFDATQSTLTRTLSNENTVYVFTAVYTKSQTTPKYSYRINQEYYTVLDGTQKTAADYTVTGDVNKTTVAGEKTVTAPTSAHTGYTFDAAQSTLIRTLSDENTVYVFTAVYTKSVTTPKYSYRIDQEYYTVLDGTQKTTADHTVTGDVNKTTVAGEKTVTAPTSAHAGYTFDAAQSTLIRTLSDENTVYVFTAVYTKSETTPVTPIPYAYSVEYYIGVDNANYTKTTAPAGATTSGSAAKGATIALDDINYPESMTVGANTYAFKADAADAVVSIVIGEDTSKNVLKLFYNYTTPVAPQMFSVEYKWFDATYTGATLPATETETVGKSLALTGTTYAPVQDGNTTYTFKGWFLAYNATDATKTVAAVGPFTADTVVLGVWTAETVTPPVTPPVVRYTVTVNFLNKADGSALGEAIVKTQRSGSSYDVADYTNMAFDGYTFLEATGDALTGTVRSDKVIDLWYEADEIIIDPEQPPLGPGPIDPIDPVDPVDPIDPIDPVEPTDDFEIVDEDTPLGNLPNTGVTSAVDPVVTLGLLALALSMAAAGLGALTNGKHKEEEDAQ